MIPKKISAATALVIISVLFFTGCKDKANTSSASSGTVSSKPSVSSDETPINSDSPPVSDTSSVSSKPHNDASSQPHLHAYKITVVPPTCTEDGYKLFKCSCGRWYTQKDKEKTGHKWKDWLVTVMPTASTEGMEERVCSVCDKKESRVLEKEAAATAEELEQELLKLINTARTENGAAELQLVTEGTLANIVKYLAENDTEKYEAESAKLNTEHKYASRSDGHASVSEAFETLMTDEEYKSKILSSDFKYISLKITMTDGKAEISQFISDLAE